MTIYSYLLFLIVFNMRLLHQQKYLLTHLLIQEDSDDSGVDVSDYF